jgi:serine/threonine-protein kinase RsbT
MNEMRKETPAALEELAAVPHAMAEAAPAAVIRDIAATLRDDRLDRQEWPRRLDTRFRAALARAEAVRENEVRVRIQSFADIVTARQQGRTLAARAGFSQSNVTIIATALSEVARNIVEYAREGEVLITLVHEGSRRGVQIVASDRGPGIPDVATVMRDGYSTGTGLGIGLPGARRLMDEFRIASEIGKGTTVTMTKWVA